MTKTIFFYSPLKHDKRYHFQLKSLTLYILEPKIYVLVLQPNKNCKKITCNRFGDANVPFPFLNPLSNI